MVKITEDLVRRKAEHNESEISTLEEIALHQENIEKIEHIQNWCRNLQILLLQSNLISRIENLWKLKKLKYLNLSLNNIERIENLEGLESLEKLDLTLNFIGELTSVLSLQKNIHLKTLILTGNPCADYDGYREYTVTILPQINELDASGISRSERIIASQRFEEKAQKIERQQEDYRKKREEEKKEEELRALNADDSDSDKEYSPEDIERFWNEDSKNTPEERIRIAKRSQRINEQKKPGQKKKKAKEVRLFNKDGQPLNINQAKVPFTLTDEEETGSKVLDVAVYKHLDSSFINVDLHSKYVTILIKGQIFQITFSEEISPDKSTCQRSLTTGHLVIKMPIIGAMPKMTVKRNANLSVQVEHTTSRRELLEIRPASKAMDFSSIYKQTKEDTDVDIELEDEVPPLE